TVPGVLGPVCLVDRGLVGVFRFGEGDVAGEPAGLYAALKTPQHRPEPGAVPAPVGPYKEVVAGPHHPDRGIRAKGPVRAQRGDLQFLRPADLVEFLGGPVPHRVSPSLW